MVTTSILNSTGKAPAFYSDKRGIFRVNNGGFNHNRYHRFGRVLSER